MLVRTHSGNAVVKRTPPGIAEWGDTNPWRFRLMSGSSSAGIPVDNDKVFGLPSVIEAIRLAAEAVASLQWGVWNLKNPYLPAAANDTWQAELIELPQLTNRFNLFQDISACVDGYGNAFVQKVKAGGKVVALRVIDPNRVKVEVKNGEVLYHVAISVSETVVYTTADIVHVRGFVPNGATCGVSLVKAFTNTLGNVLAIEEFAGSWWKNSGTTSQVIEHPDPISNTQAEQILQIYEETHGGIVNAGRPAMLTGGAKLTTVQVTAEDAQLLGSRQWSVEEIARMCHVPAELLGGNSSARSSLAKTEEVLRRFMFLYVVPRKTRIAAAFNDDPDLFAETDYWLDAKYDPVRQADIQMQAQYDLQSRQGGVETANEIRARRGLPPHPDGDELQLIPVGGSDAQLTQTQQQPAQADDEAEVEDSGESPA